MFNGFDYVPLYRIITRRSILLHVVNSYFAATLAVGTIEVYAEFASHWLLAE